MSPGARVSSIDALDAFRAQLLVYLEKAARILDDVHHEVARTRTWLQTDRQQHWKRVIRKRTAELAQAEQELLTARLSGQPGAIQDRRLAVRRAQAALADAQAGLDRVKQWLRHYESQVESRTKMIPQLGQVLTFDMAKAVQFLDRAAATLAEYAQLAPVPSSSPSAPRSGSGPAPRAPGEPQP